MFDLNYLEIFQGLRPELVIMLISIIPVAELRVAIPVALGVYKMGVWSAIFWAVLADILMTFVVLYTIGPIYNFLSGNIKIIDKFFDWLFKRTRKKFFHKYEVWGNIALMLFVAIPLPITGAGTASIASWLFGINKRHALFYISLGVIISAGIVTLLSLGVINIF
jgi:uncharacterized membrane protein